MRPVDAIAVLVVAILAYMCTPGSYGRDPPLAAWNFSVPLPRAKVAQLLVRDFQKTAPLWVDDVVSIESLKSGHLVISGQFNTVVGWKKTGDFTWEQSNRCSKLFMKAHLRPAAAEIAASPGIEWASEWRLVATSPTETQITRTLVKFEQRANWVPMHLLLPLSCAQEHERMRTKFVEAAGSA